MTNPRFTYWFRQQFQEEWPELMVEWNAYIATLDYGYDLKRMTLTHREPRPLESDTELEVAVDRGWQSTGLLLEAGKNYFVTAEGRYQIAEDEAPWMCEPGGVTLEYHQGQPLGMLLGMLRFSQDNTVSPPIPLGLAGDIRPDANAVLYLRVNDSPARLADNLGSLRARIVPHSSRD